MKRFFSTLLFFAVCAGCFAQAQDASPLSILALQIAKTEDPKMQATLLRGMNAALKGRRGVTPPPEWFDVSSRLMTSPDAEVRSLMQSLGTIFGSKEAFAGLRAVVADEKADPGARRQALETLVANKDVATFDVICHLTGKAGPLRGDAIRSLAAFENEKALDSIARIYPALSAEEKREALATAASRPSWARWVADQLHSGKIAKKDVSVTLIRQLRGFRDAKIDEIVDRHFGKSSGGSADRQGEIVKIKEWLTPEFIKSGDPIHGREIFNRSCVICHKLFDAGTEIGPELTGANRADIDYLLKNIVDPNAMIGEDYQLQTVELKDGRIVMGMVKGSDGKIMTLRTMVEAMTVPVADVKSQSMNPTSMMPEGLLSVLSREETRDLFRYLASPGQVALPAQK
jgi:putative heme-binding domain-containing protein